jgi:hypothetical protein
VPRRICPTAAITALIAVSGGHAVASPFRPLPDERARPSGSTSADGTRPGVKPLPFAQGRRFATLEHYLAFRRSRGVIDLPWYREVSPGLFELQTTKKPAPPTQRFTRAELARLFGFER